MTSLNYIIKGYPQKDHARLQGFKCYTLGDENVQKIDNQMTMINVDNQSIKSVSEGSICSIKAVKSMYDH